MNLIPHPKWVFYRITIVPLKSPPRKQLKVISVLPQTLSRLMPLPGDTPYSLCAAVSVSVCMLRFVSLRLINFINK